MMLSECCSAPPWGDEVEYGICDRCHDHCGFYDDNEESEPKYRGEFSPEQQAIIDELMKPVCAECDEPVARFSDGGTLHHDNNGRIDTEADADHTPYIKEG